MGILAIGAKVEYKGVKLEVISSKGDCGGMRCYFRSKKNNGCKRPDSFIDKYGICHDPYVAYVKSVQETTKLNLTE